MKTIKYKFTLITVALTLAACTSNDAVEPKVSSTTTDGEIVTFASSIGDQLEILAEENLDGESSTRATMSNGAFGTWDTSDKISISDGTLMYTYQPKEGSINGADCSFESKTSASFLKDGGSSEGTFYAFYPADAVLGWNGTTVSTMIYTEQKYSENVENSGVMGPYMAATATTTEGGSKASFTFGHICSVIDVDLSSFNGGTIESVALCSNTRVSLTGRMTYDADTKDAIVSVTEEGTYFSSQQSDVVVVSGINQDNPSVVRFYVLPVKQTAGLTITVRTTDGNYYTKSSTTAVGTSDANADYLASISGVGDNLLCKPFYKKYNFGTTTNAKANRWMAMIPGSTYFSMLSTPGAHNACTSSVTSYTSSSKCQSENLAGLLANGVRAFDLRPQYTSNTQSDIELNNLTIYHGIVSTGVKFKDAIDILIDFVKNNPTEAVSVIMQKQDTHSVLSLTDQSETWRASIRECFGDESRSPYLMNQVRGYHTISDVRGKISIVSKNPYGNSSNNYRDVVYGAIIENWPDDGVVTDYSCDMTQAWSWVDCHASVEDAYNSNTSTKQTQVSTQLSLASTNTNHYNYNYTFTSIANNPSSYASTMNPATVTIINNLTGPLCYVYADFIGSSNYSGQTLLKAIIAQNYKYVYKNRTRCSTAVASGTDTGVDISADEYADGGTVYAKQQNF